MAVLTRFDTPARLSELSDDHREAWGATGAGIVEPFARTFPQFYDPTVEDTPKGLTPATMAWPAFPARVRREEGPGQARWDRADGSRDEQDEYCEWSVQRNDDDTITRVTFTTEVPEYWEHIAMQDDRLLLELYHQHVDPNVERDDLFVGDQYNPRNRWNTSTTGRLAHLIQGSNNLGPP